MPGSEITNPSETAIAKLAERVTHDASLGKAVKLAVLADLASDDPAALTRLKDVLSEETENNEAHGAQGG